MISKIPLIICCLYLTACNTVNGIGTFTPELISNTMASVYIYRPLSMSNAVYTAKIFANKKSILSIKNGQTSNITLSPGNYNFEIEPDKNYLGLTKLSLDLASGHTYYIRIDTSLKISNDTNYERYQRSFNLIAVDNESAITQINDCCSSNKKDNIDQTSAQDKKESESHHFSVDKTQNPFSH